MAHYTSIQEFPSYEGSEASPTMPQGETILERVSSESENIPPPSISHRSQISPELKQCGSLCPTDQKKLFFLDNQLEKILQKTERTINEAIFVYKHIKNFEFFKSFKEKNPELQTTDALIHLCKVMKLETFFADTIVYRKEDQSNNKVYLVFSGEVIVAPTNYNPKNAEPNKSNVTAKKFKTSKTMVMKSGLDDQGEVLRRKTRMKTERIPKLTHKLSFGKDNELKSGYSANEKKFILPASMQDLKEDISMIKSKVRFDLTNFGEANDDVISSDDDSKDSIERRLELENLEQAESNGVPTTREKSGIYDFAEETEKDTAANAYRLHMDKSPKATPIKPALKKTNSRTDNSVELKNSDSGLSARKIMRASTINVGLTELDPEKMQLDKTPKGLASPKSFVGVKSFKNIIHSIAARSKASGNTPVETNSGSNSDKIIARNLTADFEDDTSVFSSGSNFFNSSMRANNNLTSKFRDSEGLSNRINPNASMNSIDTRNQEEKDFKESHGIRKGGTFGEKVLTSNGPREETMMAKNYTKILTFTLDDYDYITTRFEKKNTSKLNFLLDHIPELEKALKYCNVKNVETYFEEKCLTLHNPVAREGDKGKYIYILYEGTCKVYKDPAEPEQAPNDERKSSRTNLETPRRKMEGAPNKILVSMIQPGAFIGEEIILHSVTHYQYTVKASSAAIKVLAIRKKVFKRVMPFEVIDGLKSLSKRRKAYNETMLSQKLNIPSTISMQSRSKMNLLKRLNSGVPTKGYMRSFTNIQDDSLLQGQMEKEQLNSSIQEGVKESILLRKSSQPVLARSIKSLPIIPDDYEFGPVKKAGDLKSVLGPVQPMRTVSQDPRIFQEMSSQDKIATTSQDQIGSTAKTWNIGAQQIPFVPQKPTLKDQEAMLRKVEDEMDKVKGHYMKFSRAKVLEGIFKNEQTSFRNENSGIVSPKNSSNLLRSTKNAMSRFPKIDTSDPSNLKFDFGKENETSFRRDYNASQERFLYNKSREPRETSPRSLNTLVKNIFSKNSGSLKNILSPKASTIKTFGSASTRSTEENKMTQSGDLKGQSRLGFSTTTMSFRGSKVKKDLLRYGRSSERFEDDKRGLIGKKKFVVVDGKLQKLELSGVFPEVGVIGKQLDKSGLGLDQL